MKRGAKDRHESELERLHCSNPACGESWWPDDCYFCQGPTGCQAPTGDDPFPCGAPDCAARGWNPLACPCCDAPGYCKTLADLFGDNAPPEPGPDELAERPWLAALAQVPRLVGLVDSDASGIISQLGLAEFLRRARLDPRSEHLYWAWATDYSSRLQAAIARRMARDE